MRGNWRFRVVWSGLALTALSGCSSLWRPAGMPNDPLLVSRRPVEGKPVKTAPVALALVEPSPPLPPGDVKFHLAMPDRKRVRSEDRVVLSGPLPPAVIPEPPRLQVVPGILTNRPVRRECRRRCTCLRTHDSSSVVVPIQGEMWPARGSGPCSSWHCCLRFSPARSRCLVRFTSFGEWAHPDRICAEGRIFGCHLDTPAVRADLHRRHRAARARSAAQLRGSAAFSALGSDVPYLAGATIVATFCFLLVRSLGRLHQLLKGKASGPRRACPRAASSVCS